MPAAQINLVDDYCVQQGSTYQMSLTVYDAEGELVDLSDYTAFAQIRKTHDSSTAYDFETSIADSVVTLVLTAEISETIDFTSGVWDCELHHTDGTVSRIAEGAVQITPEVTRAP